MRHVSRLMSSGSSVLVLALALSVASPHRADARGAYNSADTSGVMVDMGALEDLGGGSNLPDLLLGRPGQPAAAPATSGSRGLLLQPDPNRGIHSRMLVNPGLIPPKSHGPVTLTPPPGMTQPTGLTELPELVPVPPTASAPPPAPAPAAPATHAAAPAATVPAAVTPPATPAPAPVAETPAPAAAAPQQTASAPATEPAPASATRPAAPAVSGSALTTLSFGNNQTDLSPDARAALDASLAKLSSSGSVQVLAYASGDRDNPSKARRTSLSRALAVRTYLIDKGIASNRIDVRALGDQSQGGSADRVDLFAGS